MIPLTEGLIEFFETITGAPHDENLVATLAGVLERNLGIAEIDEILGHGSFGVAMDLGGERVLKITSDPEEVQASYTVMMDRREDFDHVAEIYGAYRTSVRVWDAFYGKQYRPVGFVVLEKLDPIGLDNDRANAQLESVVTHIKEEFRVHPGDLSSISTGEARLRLKEAAPELVERLRFDLADPEPSVLEIARGIEELIGLGVYMIDAHPKNVGFSPHDGVHKVFDLGVSSAPKGRRAPVLRNPSPPMLDGVLRWPMGAITLGMPAPLIR